jgi:hypothetical protein
VGAEATSGDGIEHNDVAASCATAAYTHAYRFINNGKQILNIDLSYDPVGANVNDFLKTPEAYAYSQIILLGLLLGTRRIPIPGIAQILRHFLEDAADHLNKMINAGKKVIICSELVYKCFYDVGNDAYGIEIAGVDPNVVQDVLQQRRDLMPSVDPTADAAHFGKDIGAFMSTYRLARGMTSISKAIGDAAAKAVAFEGPHAVPEFVTPRDLATSPNLMLVGQLVP